MMFLFKFLKNVVACFEHTVCMHIFMVVKVHPNNKNSIKHNEDVAIGGVMTHWQSCARISVRQSFILQERRVYMHERLT